MRALRLAIPLVFALGLTGCGSDAKVVTMPDVTSKKLDVAYDKIKAAGFEDKDKIEVKGGGLFGIVVESNWTVCEQSPAAGKTVTGPPKLTVNRSCKKPEAEPSAKPTPTPTPTASKPPEILTAKNSPEFDALLKLKDYCSPQIDRFATKYARQKITFDGSISAFAGHGDTNTRFDMLVGPGDAGGNTAIGPYFQFYDKNAFDMNLTGNYPDNLAVGQKYTFTAEVGDYDADTCLFQLEPVETKAR